MPEISLTEFVDFAIKSGTPKLTTVRTIKKQHKAGYHPTRDYYCKLREGIVEMHRQGLHKSALDGVVKGLTDKNKQNTYPAMVKAYKTFLGRKKVAWFAPCRADWKHGSLKVRINPELGLEINGEAHLIKLYFKDQQLTKDRVTLISHLMFDTLGAQAKGAKVALLDVRHHRLHAFDTADPELVPLLEGEALAFCRMYEGV